MIKQNWCREVGASEEFFSCNLLSNHLLDMSIVLQMPHYEDPGIQFSYSFRPDVDSCKQSAKYLNIPPSNFSMIDRGRHQEVDDFYIVRLSSHLNNQSILAFYRHASSIVTNIEMIPELSILWTISKLQIICISVQLILLRKCYRFLDNYCLICL